MDFPKLFYIKPTEPEDLQLGSLLIPENGLEIFCNPYFHKNYRSLIFDAFINGDIEGYDTIYEKLSFIDSINAFLNIADEAEKYDFTNRSSQVLWNVNLSPYFISIVRGEILSNDLAELGTSGPQLLQKFGPIINCLIVGMFLEASYFAMITEPDNFLTISRLQKYASFFTTSDAIIYN